MNLLHHPLLLLFISHNTFYGILAGGLYLITRQTDLTTLEFEGHRIPAVIIGSGANGAEEFLNFFAGMIRNANTRQAYLRARDRFGIWCKQSGLEQLSDIRPLHVAAYIESISFELVPASVKQHRAALSKCFDFLVVGVWSPVVQRRTLGRNRLINHNILDTEINAK